MIVLASLLGALALGLLWRCQKLAVRCAVAEERIKGQEAMEEAFEQVSEKAQRSLLTAAKEDLGARKEEIAAMMGKLEAEMRKLESERKIDHGMVRQQMKTLFEAEQQLKTETSNLAKALRSPIARGRWGEIQLKRVVELAGMLSHCDFTEQTADEGSRQRPDLIIHLPGGRQVIIDAKAPLDAYLEGIGSEEGPLRLLKLKEHSKQVRSHIQALGRKSYWENFQPTPEFVILFLPSETIFGAALEHDPTLIEAGVEQGVIVATPTTLIALLRAVSYGWKQESLSKHAEKVSELGHELYKRVVDMQGHWARTGKSLSAAVEAYNKATGSMESRVLVTARKFKEMGAASATLDLPEAEAVSVQTREPQVIE